VSIASLTQSLCKVLIERSPLHAWTNVLGLNPNYEPDDDTKFDIGNVAHRVLLGPWQGYLGCGFFLTGARRKAQELREAAAIWLHRVLRHQFEQAHEMAEGP